MHGWPRVSYFVLHLSLFAQSLHVLPAVAAASATLSPAVLVATLGSVAHVLLSAAVPTLPTLVNGGFGASVGNASATTNTTNPTPATAQPSAYPVTVAVVVDVMYPNVGS